MAEFQEVIKQFKRLCDSANQDCSSCGIGDMSCSIKDIVDNSVEFEKRVMSWAAEHPEQVYPTWEEWLIMQGVIKENPNGIGWPMPKLFERIPADIVDKLGIEPKEV